MGGEHGPKIERGRSRKDVFVGVTESLQPSNRLREATILGPSRTELVDAMHLLGGVRQMEVDREGADQMDGIDQLDVVQRGSQLIGGSLIATQIPSDRPHLLDPIQQRLAVLADQRITQLSAEPTDVGSKGGIKIVKSFGGHVALSHIEAWV